MRAIVVLALAAGCAGTVRQQDLAAWQGAPTAELQTHQLYSTRPKTTEKLADGSELWTYSNCGSGTSPRVCNMVGETMVCTGGHQYESCCYSQFMVNGPRVAWVRMTGSCHSDCSVRPASRQCEPEPAQVVTASDLATRRR